MNVEVPDATIDNSRKLTRPISEVFTPEQLICGPEASNIDVEPQTTISDAKTDCIRHEAFDLGATNRSDGGSRSEPLQSSFFSGKLEQAEQQRESTRPVQTRKDKNEENVGEFDGSTSPIFKHPTLTGDRDERDQQKRFQKQLMQHEHLEAQLAETRRLLRSSEDEMKSIRKEVQETEHRLTQELAKKVTSLRDLEGRFVKMSAELQMSLLDSQAKNRVLEDTLKTNQSLFRRAVSERDSMQKAKAMLSFRLQVAQDQIRELEHKLNSSASCSESQMARLNRTLEGVAEVAVAARHASARIRSTLKQAGTSVKIATPSKAAKQSFETSVVSSIRQLTDDTPVLIERRLPSKEVASSKVGLRSSQDKLNSLSQRIDASRRSSELEVTSDVNQRSAEVISRPAGDEQVNANNSFSWSHAGHSHCVRAARMGFNRGSSARRSDRYSRLSMNQSETGCSKRSSRLVPDTSKSDKIGELLNKGITKADRLRDVIGRLRQFIHTTRPLTESWDKKENRGLTQSVESGSHPKLPNSISHNGK
uniref:RING-type domain-containing protein n=1 Tax=Mesocestoides corti TaxID=53468 RepID=A0A5K3EZT4_MESCO